MALTLSRFSQEVDVISGSLDVSYFAIFKSDDGRELKLPISANASQTIISFFADKKGQPPESLDKQSEEVEEEEPSSQEIEQQATVFGGDDYPLDAPDSEDQVPSL